MITKISQFKEKILINEKVNIPLEVGKHYKVYDMNNQNKLIYSSLLLKDITESDYHFYATNRIKDNDIVIPVNTNYMYIVIKNPILYKK